MLRKLLLLSLLHSAMGAFDTSISFLRRLEIGDFDAINKLIADLSFPLPDQTVTQDVAGSTLTLDLAELVCSGLNIGDVQVYYHETDTLDVTLELIQADIQCQTHYTYNYLFFNGGGTGYLTTQDNAVTLNLTLTSDADTLMHSAPVVTFVGCDSTVNISDLQLDGDGLGVMAEILNALEFALKGLVADQIKTFLCEEVSSLQTVVQTGLDNLHDVLSLDTSTPVDPLEAESKLDPKVDWLDFLHPTSWMEKAVNSFFDQAKNLLVNNIDQLWSGLLDKDGSLLLNITSLGVPDETISSFLGNISFRLQSTRIYGLDSLNVTNLTVLGSSTLSAAMSVGSLRGELGCEFEMKVGNKSYKEDALLTVQLDNIAVQLAVLVAIDEGKLGDVALGSLLMGEWDCLLTALQQFDITQLLLNVTAQQPTVSGIRSPGLDRLVQDAIKQMFDTYGEVLNQAFPMWIQAAAMGLDLQLPTSPTTNCSEVAVSGPKFMDFRDLLLPANVSVEYGGSGAAPYGSMVPLLKDYVTSYLANSSALANVMDMILTPFTGNAANASSNDLVWSKPLIDYSGDIAIGGLDAGIVLKVDHLTIQNLASLTDPKILEPVRGEANMFNNSVDMAVSEPLRLSAHVVLQITTSENQSEVISNEMIVSVEMRSVQLAIPVLAKMLSSQVMNFPVKDLLNWQCWLSTIPAPELDSQGRRTSGSDPTLSIGDIAFSARSMNFTVDCLNCTSPKFQELATLLSSPATDEIAAESATHVINFLLYLVDGDNSMVQTSIDRMLVDAPKHCPHSPAYDPNATATSYEAVSVSDPNDTAATFLLTMIICVAAVAAALVVILLAVRCMVSRRHRKWLTTLPPGQVLAIYDNQKAQRERELAMDIASSSLIRSPSLSLFVRWGVPVVILGNIALFLSGHLSLGGEVRIYLQIGGQELVVSDFYAFSIAQSGIELWNAGAKAIALLMLLFSGVWPYFKQLLTLLLWVLPPRFVSISKRGSVLLWLDTLAKWSMIDVFVMIVTVAAFHVTIQSPDKPFLPQDFYQVDLLVVPLWGLYANMLAQLVSQIASHFIIYYHRVAALSAARQVESKTRSLSSFDSVEVASTPEDEPTSIQADDVVDSLQASVDAPDASDTSEEASAEGERALFRHAFTRPHRGESETLHVRSWVNFAFFALSIATIVLLLVGCILPSYSFDYLGLVGVAVESGMDFQQARTNLSVISTAQLLMDQARFLGDTKDMVGMLSVAIVLIMTTLIVPIAQIFTLSAEWFLPLRHVVSGRLRVAIEIFQAWQYVEVFLLSVIVAVWQIGPVSTFMVNDYCGGLSGFFAFMVINGILDPSDGQCFRAQASIESASYILIAAAAVLILLTSFVSRATVQRARDETSQRSIVPSSATIPSDGDSSDESLPLAKITPVPVLFTDQFRWLLTANP